MQALRNLLDKQAKHFQKGGRLEKLYPLWEATDTFLFTPGEVTQRASHARDGLDLKRMMMTVVIALTARKFGLQIGVSHRTRSAARQEAPAVAERAGTAPRGA